MVVLDRSKLSTVAYQSSMGLTYEGMKRREETAGIVDPDVVFYLYVKPQISMSRKKMQRDASDEAQDRHEKDIALQERVLGVFDRMMQEGWGAKKWVHIDGDNSVVAIRNEIAGIAKAEIGSKLAGGRLRTGAGRT